MIERHRFEHRQKALAAPNFDTQNRFQVTKQVKYLMSFTQIENHGIF